jgi:hypothetical protein
MAQPFPVPKAEQALAHYRAALAALQQAETAARDAHEIASDHDLTSDEPRCPPDEISDTIAVVEAHILALQNGIGFREAA